MKQDQYEKECMAVIRGQFSKDEAVQALLKRIKQIETHSGVQQSEIDELKDELRKSKKVFKAELKEEYNREEHYMRAVKKKNTKIRKLEELCERLRKSNDQLLQRLNVRQLEELK